MRPPLVQPPPPQLRFQQKDTEQYHVCLAAPGISRSDRRRFAASLLDAILGGSASSRLFQEIREKRGMAYAVYSFVSQYTDTGQIGVYLGTREDNLAEALAITAEQIADIAGGNLPDRELERAKENLKGRILLSMESTSTRMNRLGKSLITDSELLSLDRIVAEIDAVEASSVSRARRRAARAGAAVGGLHRARTRSGSSRRSSASRPTSRARREDPPERPRRARSARCSRPALEAAGHTLVDSLADARRDGRLHAARRGARRTCAQQSTPACRSVVGTTGWDTAAVADAPVAGLLRAELRDRRGADDAVRGRGGQALRRAPRSSSCTIAAKLDAPSGTAKLTAERMGGDVPIHSVRLPGLNAHQEVMLGGAGETADDPPRRDLARGVHAGRAARAREAAVAAARAHGRP